MKLLADSVTSFTPDHGWTAHFKTPDESWSWPVIGWATVVAWSSDEDTSSPVGPRDTYMTTLEALILVDDNSVTTLGAYVRYDIASEPGQPAVEYVLSRG